jgi:glycosyltransferase involved in cell wall biosynthesis
MTSESRATVEQKPTNESPQPRAEGPRDVLSAVTVAGDGTETALQGSAVADSTVPDKRPLRVAVLDPIGRGSLLHYAVKLTEALVALGVETTLVTSSDTEARLWPASVRVERRLGGARRREMPRPRRAAAYALSLAALLRWLRQQRFDIVHLHESLIPPVDALLARVLEYVGLPLVYTAHDPDHDYVARMSKSRWSLHRRSLEALYRRSRAIICLSRLAYSHLISVKGVKPERVVHIPHANHLSLRDGVGIGRVAARARLGISRDEKVVLLFGYLKQTKGLSHLLDAFSIVRSCEPRARLLIAGMPRAGVNVAEIQQGIDKLRLQGAVVLHPWFVPEETLPLYFLAADIVVLPYLRVYQSGILHVAYAFGRPVVASAVGSLVEDVRDGRSGLLVRPGDSLALAEALCALLRDNDARRRMGSYARRMANEIQYSWRQTAKDTLAVYERVLAGDGAH